MSNRKKPATPRRGEAFRCLDCDSQIKETWPDPKPTILRVELVHSPTCPVWTSDEPELIVEMGPKTTTEGAGADA